MIEGYPPFSAKKDSEVPKSYCAKERPPFRAPAKLYSHRLKELVPKLFLQYFMFDLLISFPLFLLFVH